MRTIPTLAALLIVASSSAFAAEPCQSFHGRALYYSADGQFRIWHIGTHHTFEPPDMQGPNPDYEPSWNRLMKILLGGNQNPDDHAVFADFVVCPTEPFRKGTAQKAIIQSIRRPHVVPRDQDGEPHSPQ
jgi:hypothetical protein